jgi:prepilin peptidase CpaA
MALDDLMDVFQPVLTALVAGITFAAAWMDLRAQKIPNQFTVSALASGLLFHLVRGSVTGGVSGAGQGLLFSLAGFATGFGILLVLWLIGGGGGGDVKFMGALGGWLGAKQILVVFLVSVLIVLVYSAVVLLWHASRAGFRRTKKRFGGTLEPESEARRVGRRILPYAVPVAIATWCVLAYPYIKQYLLSQAA